MPKKTAQRIIDSRRSSNVVSISGVTLTGGSSGVSSTLAGAGLTYADGVLDVGAGTLITVGADSVGVTAGSTYQFVGTGSGTAAGWRNVSELAGAGLTAATGVLAVGAGTLVTVGADTVGITAGANYQFIGTGSGTAAAWQNLSTLAGNGLTHSAGVLAVGAGDAISVAADAVAVASTIAGDGLAWASGVMSVGVANTGATGLSVEANAVRLTSSANPGAAASILATSAAGLVQLVQVASNATFASGFAGSGYRVDYGVTEASKASAEFDNLTVRGRMRVYELLIQQIRATNGSVFVSSSSKVLTATADSNPLWTVNGSQLTFNGSNANLTTTLYAITTSTSGEAGASRTHYHGFLSGDIIRAQQVLWNGSAFAGVIQSNLEVTGVTNLYTYQAAMVSGDAPAVGYDYVRLGSATSTTRQGSIYLTSDDSNAPFVDIVDTVRSHDDWNTVGKIKTRVGKLSGITDSYFGTLSGYGLYSDNVYLKGSIFATSGYFKGTVYAEGGMFNGTVYATDGSFTGTVTAAAGTIGGWTIGATALTAGSGATTVGVDSGGSNPAFYAGSATPGSAPFRVTQAGALTASNATITGAITANSGSLDGFLTIGASGGIYQGTGTSGTPTSGLKVFNDSGVGQLALYNSGTKTMRLSSDDLRLQMATSQGGYKSIRWLQDIDGTDSALTSQDYRVDMHAWTWNNGISDIAEFAIVARVNAGEYDTRRARVGLTASNYNGSTYNTTAIYVYQGHSGDSYKRNILFDTDYIQIDRYGSTPADTPASGTVLLWVDSATNTLKMKDSSGTTRSVTFS